MKTGICNKRRATDRRGATMVEAIFVLAVLGYLMLAADMLLQTGLTLFATEIGW